MIFALFWIIPVGLLFLILLAVLFPRIVRGLLAAFVLLVLYVIGGGLKGGSAPAAPAQQAEFEHEHQYMDVTTAYDWAIAHGQTPNQAKSFAALRGSQKVMHDRGINLR